MTTDPRPAGHFTGLFETHLNVADLERAMRFYGTVLGLELGIAQPERRVALYWIGGPGRTMLGLWEKPLDQVRPQHFAFEVAGLAGLQQTIAALKQEAIELRNFFDETTDVPSVFGWMPAASIYFRDPDGHLLEALAMLPGPPRPERGVVSLPEWERETRG